MFIFKPIEVDARSRSVSMYCSSFILWEKIRSHQQILNDWDILHGAEFLSQSNWVFLSISFNVNSLGDRVVLVHCLVFERWLFCRYFELVFCMYYQLCCCINGFYWVKCFFVKNKGYPKWWIGRFHQQMPSLFLFLPKWLFLRHNNNDTAILCKKTVFS